MSDRAPSLQQPERVAMQRAEVVLGDLVGIDHPGIGRGDPETDGVAADIVRAVPHLRMPWRLRGKLDATAPQTSLLRLLDADTRTFAASPLFYCWPFFFPTFQGQSLLTVPEVRQPSAQHRFVIVTARWVITPSRVQCSAATLDFTANASAESGNDLSEIPDLGTTRTWTHFIGSIDADGTFHADGNLTPFIPPPLR